MPEGPELFLASRYINAECAGITFTGKVEKSEVSKNPEVPFESDGYLISAVSRGKELKLTLTPIKREGSKEPPMDLVFRFGMSGNFKLVPVSDMPKHAHLRFYTQEEPLRVLCYVDVRRFGKWEVDGTWQPNRGPCVMLEYEQFRENILRNLSDKAFDKPICEALLNQKFFNGVGNYLRAEILYQSKIPPFEKARTILEDLQRGLQVSGATTLSKKVKLKRENPDFLEVCHLLPMEVVNLGGGKGYDPTSREDFAVFEEWLHCYSVPGMKSLRDANGRTIWFQLLCVGDCCMNTCVETLDPWPQKRGNLRKRRHKQSLNQLCRVQRPAKEGRTQAAALLREKLREGGNLNQRMELFKKRRMAVWWATEPGVPRPDLRNRLPICKNLCRQVHHLQHRRDERLLRKNRVRKLRHQQSQDLKG